MIQITSRCSLKEKVIFLEEKEDHPPSKCYVMHEGWKDWFILNPKGHHMWQKQQNEASNQVYV